MSKDTRTRADNAFDPLDDFQIQNLTFLNQTRRVYVAGKGPAVVVMTEMPGIHPLVGRFARWVRDAGFTVWMPSLFGTDGKPISLGYGLGSMVRGCISREFRAFAANETGPIVDWLRALSAHAFPVSGGKGVGAIGMCFTGNFALSMMLEPSMLAPVLAQPSLPIGKAGGMHIAPNELAQVKARLEREDLTVMAYRFEGDAFCKRERFQAYEDALGSRFIGRVLPDASANPDAMMKNPHSVFTGHLIDRAGEPTRVALDEVLAFFSARLKG